MLEVDDLFMVKKDLDFTFYITQKIDKSLN